MSDEQITIAERIRRIVKAHPQGISAREIYAADDNFENVAQVCGQMSPFLARGEFIGTKGDGGRVYYSAVECYVPRAQGVRGPAKAADGDGGSQPVRNSGIVIKPQTNYDAHVTDPPPPPSKKLREKLAADIVEPAPVDDEIEGGDDVEFFISAGGWLSIQVGDDSVMIDPKHIGRLNKFTDATAALWGGV